jgi:cytochrome c oxidase subunit 2
LVAALAVPAALLLVSGCASDQNALAPESHQASDIASLWWWMFGGSLVGVGVIAGIIVFAWIRRDRRGLGSDVDGTKPGERRATAVVLGLGVALPVVALATLFVVSDIFVIRATQAPAASRTRLTVQVVGHQWFWEVRYPGTKSVTANEIHIPLRTPVLVEAMTADVIHSFWVPRLNRKIDMIPGRVNRIELDARRPGRYRGQCAEFCGLQHAHMALEVVVQPPGRFRAWLANMARATRPVTTALEHRGQQIFVNGPCASCHTIRGTGASGDVGPDLTHLASRSTIAAATLTNTPRDLETWITDNQHVKPGNQMPEFRLHGSQLRALVAYLESRR